MAGYRDNPRPNPENVLEIKLNESEVSQNIMFKYYYLEYDLTFSFYLILLYTFRKMLNKVMKLNQ